MEYRTLGKSGLKVSEIGLGGNNFGVRLGEQESISVIRYALEKGINFIDTADTYGNGRSEELIGKAVKGHRPEAIIATKFGGVTGEHPDDRGASRYHVINAIDASLKRLDTDYIDLYYIHRPDPTTSIEETLRTLDNLVRVGKVRYIGCSNFGAWLLCETMWISKVNNLEPFVVTEARYNILNRGIETELIPCCQAYGTGVIPYNPLFYGFLTGKYHRGEPVPVGTTLSDPRFKSMVLSEANFDKLEKLQSFAAEHGHSVGELAIAWLLSHSWLSSVIAGATSPEQVAANVAASSWKLTAQEVVQVEKLL